MSLLRRRMMMQSAAKGFEYVYDASEGGLPTDDGFVLVRPSFDGIMMFNINHGGAREYIYLPDHEQEDNCSIEIEASINGTCLIVSLCDNERYANACMSYWNNRFIVFPINDTGSGTPYQNITQDTFYVIKVEKRGGKCSFYLDGVPVAENIDCKSLPQIPSGYSSNGRISIQAANAGSFNFGSTGVAKVKRFTYKEW